MLATCQNPPCRESLCVWGFLISWRFWLNRSGGAPETQHGSKVCNGHNERPAGWGLQSDGDHQYWVVRFLAVWYCAIMNIIFIGWGAYHFQLWGLPKWGLNVHRALRRALDTQWVITTAIIIQLSSSCLLLCRFWCSSAWWRPFAVSWFGVRLLYFFFPLFSIKARIYQSLQEAGWAHSQKASFKYPLFA